jgi:hypothetical protein
MKAVSDALSQLLASTKIAEAKESGPDFAPAAKEILDETARLMAAQGNPSQINSSIKVIVGATTRLVSAAKQQVQLLSNK